MNKRKYLIGFIIIAVVSLAALWLNYDRITNYIRIRLACADAEINYYKYPILGIDVSAHQKDIDWNKVYDANVKFAFIKATEGENFKDKKYTKNIREAKKNHIFVSAYHFYRFSKSGKSQAINFINSVDKDLIDFPPVVDIEDYGYFFSTFTHSRIVSEIFICLRELEKHYKIRPIIYTNPHTYKKYIEGNFEEYSIWISRLCREPDDDDWIFWQYSHTGALQGIEGDVDLNTFNGDYSDFDRYINEIRKQKQN